MNLVILVTRIVYGESNDSRVHGDSGKYGDFVDMAKLVILIILMILMMLVSFRILGILVKMVVLVLLVNLVVWHSFCLKLRDDSVLVVKFWYGKLCLFKIKEMVAVGRWINSAVTRNIYNWKNV